MMQGHQQRDGLRTFGLCVAVMAAVFLLDDILGQRDLAMTHDAETAGQETTRSVISPSIPDVVITGFRFLHALPTPGTKPLWQLTARTAVLFEQRQKATMQEIQAMFQPYDASGASGGELDGEEGHLDLGRLDFDVTGRDRPVTLRLGKRYTLTTSRLHWDNTAARMTTDQPAQIVGEGLTMTGLGFQWVEAGGTMSLLRDVHTTVMQ
jgi:hypothetical protein